ncbi:disulfide bond formation protein B [Caulobacter sp. 17J80-11]|uniref:disulfide bond formation protein B n=1 Tax=Caulobacter sp. 17J80-11 TaxID=2763502 RepID=UPI0016534BD1|nr:disulfide bond formation protein B [Caulobacter sp. 17J80-11]MBC6980394.1 disulfide bond formation protein B [Caulobacter sp. 17J80-11]
MSVLRFIFRWWTLFALLAAAAMLATAHGFQHFAGYAPCHLCLEQRKLYWAAIAIALPASAWAVFTRSKGTPRVAAFLLFAVFASEAIVATFHAGVELKWWRGPESCTGGGGSVDIAGLQSLLTGGSFQPPMCDVAVWSWGGLSMAGWNAVIATGLALASLIASMRRKENVFRGR